MGEETGANSLRSDLGSLGNPVLSGTDFSQLSSYPNPFPKPNVWFVALLLSVGSYLSFCQPINICRAELGPSGSMEGCDRGASVDERTVLMSQVSGWPGLPFPGPAPHAALLPPGCQALWHGLKPTVLWASLRPFAFC